MVPILQGYYIFKIMNQNNTVKVMGIAVALLVLAAIIIMVNYRAEEVPVNENENAVSNTDTPLGKVAAANIEDGEYYAYVEAVNSSPEDTTVTFKHVMYFEGEVASSTAANEGRSAEVRNGVYVRESGAPGFTAPLGMASNISADGIRMAINDPSYRPAFRVTIQEGAIVKMEEVTKR
jgi:hypothetical protein